MQHINTNNTITTSAMALQNFLNKLTTLYHYYRGRFTDVHNKSAFILELIFYNIAMFANFETKSQSPHGDFSFFQCSSGKLYQSTACSVLHHPRCTSSFLYTVLLIQ